MVWASGTRLGRRLRWLESTSEAITDGDLAGALRRLKERVKPAQPHVVVHLDPLHIRHALLQGPAFDDTVSFDAWLRAEASRQLPPRAGLEDFIIRIQRLEEAEEYSRCLLALVSRKAVEQRVALLEEAGLRPIRMSSLDVAVGEALGLAPAFAERASAVLIVRVDDAVLLQYQEGLLQSLVTLPYGAETADATAFLHEVSAHLSPLPERIYVAGMQVQSLIDRAQEARLLEGLVQAATLEMVPDAQALLSPEDLPAAALALQELFPAPDAFNFLEPDVVEGRLQEAEKHEAVRTVLALGSVVGLLFLIITLLTVYLTGKKAETEGELATLADQVERIEQAHASVAQLSRDIARAERLVVERTNVARVLEGIGRVAQAGLWLDAVTLEEVVSGTPQLTLAGTAFSKGDIAAYLDSLEQAPFARNVRLRYSESVRASSLYKQATVQDRPLTQFEIQLDLTSPARDPEASK